jgi:hypothetical protein
MTETIHKYPLLGIEHSETLMLPAGGDLVFHAFERVKA